ncbi:hypothetical protein RND64_12330 [Gordonia sp. w5E2]|jgi:hypothetical protein|uniref:Phage gp6-like head-tail connector protein n=1 Tax=Gordonia jacobaea TaxID=122202 RepID=A0ABR5I7M6_9ACTN|nr:MULTISPECIES: hypothetical protein [Gordonia]KNA89680.1 hypothetical protein ABW18_19980 [Gordonia jacobaea]DAL64975.1 MAG TPA_asm: Protein of unknown function (DUF3199) [Caudoviricetes sp.]HQV19579.1 hypothetical protein [Gordonia sp. (in: high G+C Gram-positive bacteria)]
MAVTPTDLVKWLGEPTTDTDLMAQAGQAITMASAMCDAYTRGQHVKADGITTRPGVDAVVQMAAARMLANPEGLRYSTGVVTFNQAFEGFTLAERIVLDRYRRKAA